jgi:signal transduction histidine kinase
VPADDNSIRILICDDGTGFNPHQVDGGLGMEQMRARVRRSGGTMTLESAPGEGTTISVALPRHGGGDA